jgi:hypothetical protein
LPFHKTDEHEERDRMMQEGKSPEVKDKEHSMLNIIIASGIAGSTAAFWTNGVELMAVNKQANPNFSVL